MAFREVVKLEVPKTLKRRFLDVLCNKHPTQSQTISGIDWLWGISSNKWQNLYGIPLSFCSQINNRPCVSQLTLSKTLVKSVDMCTFLYMMYHKHHRKSLPPHHSSPNTQLSFKGTTDLIVQLLVC